MTIKSKRSQVDYDDIPQNPQNESMSTINKVSIILILVCMVFWSVVFIATAISTRNDIGILTTVGAIIIFWIATWLIYWLGWKLYWLMLALGWVLGTLYCLTIFSTLTQAVLSFRF